MRLVQHPSADLPLRERLAHRDVAQLFRSDDENTGVAQAHTLQRLPAFGQRKQTVDGEGATDAVPLQADHLIRHQRHQGGDHYREGTGLVVAGERGNLVAEGFAGTRGQDAEHRNAGHRRFHDGLLHGPAFAVLGHRAEVLEAEPALQLLAGILPLSAPFAGGIRAGRISQLAHQLAGMRKLMPYPRRHHRTAAGDGQPSQCVGQRPAMPLRLPKNILALLAAGGLCKPLADSRVRLGSGRSRGLAKGGEEGVKAGRVQGRRMFLPRRRIPLRTRANCRRQPVPCEQQIRRRPMQCLALIRQEFKREPCVQLRIVHPCALELPILIVLDQVVVGVARKSQRVQPKGVYGGSLEQAERRVCGPQVG